MSLDDLDVDEAGGAERCSELDSGGSAGEAAGEGGHVRRGSRRRYGRSSRSPAGELGAEDVGLVVADDGGVAATA